MGQAGSVRELVALDLPPGPSFVEALRAAWDAGDAILPIDQRLSVPVRQALLDAAGPHSIVSTDGGRTPVSPGAPPMGESDALVVSTSGSTGRPKPIVHTFNSLTAHAHAVHARLDIDARRDRWLACLPLAHLGGLGVVVRSIVTDTPFDVLDRFDAAIVGLAPRQLGSTLVSLVPTALDRIDPAPFRQVVLGGGPDQADRPPNVVRTYGLTETGGGVVYDGTALADTELDVGEDGSIRLRGPTLARGHRHDDGEVVPLVDGEDWLTTGDLGHWDEEGLLVVDGRRSELIITGGENVWPDPVETVLGAHPGVEAVAVVGRTDAEWGQRVVAVVVPRNPGWPPRLEELRNLVRSQLVPFAAPSELVLVDHLPRTALGKVRRPQFDG